ncbi:MAG TPA: YlxR family protein [Actinomycetales bacterium]|nr:YlxR family protein [Actinomycetales bacterium]
MGCRRRGARSVLLRLVAVGVDGEVAVVLDHDRTMPGRGAWLHPHLECLELARRRSALVRALRLAGPVDLAGMAEQVTALLQGTSERRIDTSPSPSAMTRATGSGSER